MTYADKIKSILSPLERTAFKRLSTPQKIQDYLDSLPINFELSGETYFSATRVLKEKTAHCLEGAVLAAAALAFHGQKPLLLDLLTGSHDESHVVTLFKQNGYWGAISKTNHSVLRWRDPVYRDVRELAVSYFHEYFSWKNGRKSLIGYSVPLDLRRFKMESWITAEEDLFWLVEALDSARHFPLVPKKNSRALRKASKTEIKAISEIVEWKEPENWKGYSGKDAM